MAEDSIRYHATCPRGCERFLAEELRELGFANVAADRSGAFFSGDRLAGPRACLWSRIASRVLQPVAEFEAADADQLYRKCLELPWEDHLSSLNTFALHGIGSNVRIRHSGFLALKVKDALVDRMRRKVGRRPSVDRQNPDVRFVVRLSEDTVNISLDLCGESLHRRGWRMKDGEAPLKETLAAALLRAAGYTGREILFDPMCGSATILIEAAETALGLAPGRRLEFGFERWPTFPKVLRREFSSMRAESGRPRIDSPPPIVGADLTRQAVSLGTEHLRAARLTEYVRLERKDARKAIFPGERGLLLTNPPYGERIDIDDDVLLDLYADLGKRWRLWPDVRLAVFCANPGFQKAFGGKVFRKHDLFNGPLKTSLFVYAPRAEKR